MRPADAISLATVLRFTMRDTFKNLSSLIVVPILFLSNRSQCQFFPFSSGSQNLHGIADWAA
jgi:hypothetical protein